VSEPTTEALTWYSPCGYRTRGLFAAAAPIPHCPNCYSTSWSTLPAAQPADPPATALREALREALLTIYREQNVRDGLGHPAVPTDRDLYRLVRAALAAHPTPAEEPELGRLRAIEAAARQMRTARERKAMAGPDLSAAVVAEQRLYQALDAARPSPAAVASALALAPDVETDHELRSGR
jgi:hypothetical protein